ncbi:MAG TPA: FAD-binding oxidoreductase [Solirubrobacteraceae bacterium]|nr:FAD-binding oxidoreductase [Solirubrobacteraceae bacterium]
MSGKGPAVCVVGAGAIGLSSALELARRGSEVTVIEARHVAAGSSGLSVGIIETQYLDRLDIELRVRAMRAFEWLEREHGLTVVRNGYLRLGHDSASCVAFERSVQIQRELGVRCAEVLDRAEIERLVPDMRTDDLQAGLLGRGDGFLDGHLYCGLLAELAVRAGARLRLATELLGAEPLTSGGLRLETSGGELECDIVVDAAGPWAAKVAMLLGYELEMAPQRHQASLVHLPYELSYTMPSVMDYTPGSGERGLYFRHEGAGRLIAGLHGEEASALGANPDRYARQADEEFLEELAGKLSSRLPGLADAALAGGWAGLYPVSITGRPLVGPAAPGAPVILAAGAGGSGIQLSPVMGELVADWILHGEPRAVAGARQLAPY